MTASTFLRADDRRRAFAAAALFVLLLLVACYPVLATQYLPLADYPNHLARIYILDDGRHSQFLRGYFDPMIQAQPNLAMDLIVLALRPFLSIEAGAKVSIVIAFLLISTGAHVLHRVLAGTWSPWPNIVFLFIYNRLFYWGFISFMVGLGLMLYGVALWLALRDRPWWRVAASCAFAVVLYISHLFAFAAYALIIGGIDLFALIKARAGWRAYLRAAAMGGAQFVLPALLFVFVSPTAAAAEHTTWGIFFKKIAGVFYTTSSYVPAFDMACLGIVALIVLAGLALRALRLPSVFFISVGLLLAVGVAMPEQIFSSYFASERIPLVLAFLALPALVWTKRHARWELAASVAVTALILVKMTLVVQQWRVSDRLYAEAVAAIKTIQPQSRVYSIIVNDEPRMLPDTPFLEIASFAVLYRDAFIHSLFAWPYNAAQSVGYTKKGQALVERTPSHKVWLPNQDDREFPWLFNEDILRNYDYVFVYNEKRLTWRPPAWLETMVQGTNFRLLRVPKTGSAEVKP